MTPTLSQITRVFARIGTLSFGGPAAQIALMHKELVEDRPWLTEAQFLRALSFCMMLPGPEAMQLATYAGWRLHGLRGGLIGGLLFVLPGALVIAALAAIYATFGTVPLVLALFLGVQATVVVVVVLAIGRLARKALRGPGDWVLAVLAFVALFALHLPFPLVIAGAAVWGATRAEPGGTPLPALAPSVRVAGICAALWAAPLVLAWGAGAEVLLSLGLFFSKLAVVTFGGAYAVLAYMTQAVVETHGWLTTDQMMDALGLAETTPGPLILVTQFVGHLVGAQGAGFILAGLMVLWVTFVPCFLWIFAGAPLIDWLEHQPRIASALAAVTAAVVGVIANLSLWFAAHVWFGTITEVSFGPAQVIAPVWDSLSWMAVGLTALAGVLMGRGLSLPLTLAVVASAAGALSLIF